MKVVDKPKVNENKWTKKVLEPGWVVVPNVLLECQEKLGLSAMDLNILLQIIRHWWKKDELPFPSKKTLAISIGVSESTIQKRVRKMEKDGLIKRNLRYKGHNGQTSNEYDIAGLVKKLDPLARESLALRKERIIKKQSGRK